jgi:hypothetical protein
MVQEAAHRPPPRSFRPDPSTMRQLLADTDPLSRCESTQVRGGLGGLLHCVYGRTYVRRNELHDALGASHSVFMTVVTPLCVDGCNWEWGCLSHGDLCCVSATSTTPNTIRVSRSAQGGVLAFREEYSCSQGGDSPRSYRMPLPLSLTPQTIAEAMIRPCAAFAQVWCTLRLEGWGGPRLGFGLCDKMCLACALDLMRPSVHSWHRRESIDVVSAQIERELGSAE